MFKKILWATDGSAAGDEALPLVRELAGAEGAELVVFHSDQRLAGSRAAGMPVYVDESDVKEKIRGQVSEFGDGVELDIAPGSTWVGAAHDVVEAADRHGADVIVVATRGHTAIGGLLLGSVTQRLLHIAHCPVLVVPVHDRESETPVAAGAAEAGE